MRKYLYYDGKLHVDSGTSLHSDSSTCLLDIEVKSVLGRHDTPEDYDLPPMREIVQAVAEALAKVLPAGANIDYGVVEWREPTYDSVTAKGSRKKGS